MNGSPTDPHLPPDPQGVRRLDFRALGTNCSIKFRLGDDRTALEFAARALEWLGDFEAKFSRYRPDSMLSRINRAAGGDWVAIDPEMAQMLDLADEVFR